MACFVIPLTQAVATTIARKSTRQSSSVWATELPKLELMLWGGSLMLIVDHILNGEVTWVYPFFTALHAADGATVMLREMLTIGVPMSLTITAVWAAMTVYKSRATVKA